MIKLFKYLRESRKELKNVTWVKKEFAFYMALLVIVISVIIGVLLGFFDIIFIDLLKKFVL